MSIRDELDMLVEEEKVLLVEVQEAQRKYLEVRIRMLELQTEISRVLLGET
jgi:hypothetical protein